MTEVIEAIYSHGVLEPLEALEFPEQQRVRLLLQPINGDAALDRGFLEKRCLGAPW